MGKRILGFVLFTATLSMGLVAEEAAAPSATSWKEDFNDGRRYVVQRVDNDPQKAATCRKEYKDGALILHYKFGQECSKAKGTFAYGIATPIDLKGGTALEIRYRTPVKGLNNLLTWTYTDASGKRFGDWKRLPASTEWSTVRIEMHKDGFAGQKNSKPEPVKLVALEIYSSAKNDDVERSIEIDYICVPAKD
ncbi:MAG: hypothetical protein IJJ33_10320 [Victivallales bacterium]|nr:hypothetical protein [Victivallales bacterium]